MACIRFLEHLVAKRLPTYSAQRYISTWLIVLVIYSFTLPLSAQPRPSSIQAQYTGIPLQDVLQDLHKRYGLRFAYSPKYIPLNQLVTLSVQQASVHETLTRLFNPLPVRFVYVGDQIVLKYSSKPSSGTLNTKELPEEVSQQTPLYTDPRLEELRVERQKKIQEELPVLTRRTLAQTAEIDRSTPAENLDPYRNPPTKGSNKSASRLAQVSLLPYLGTNALQAYRISNRVSLNLLWGLNGGVNGLEIGGVANKILYDVKGIQIAGAVNLVGSDLTGVQFAGLVNHVQDTIQGLQIAGLANIAGKAYAVQSAALVNIAKVDFSGVQATAGINYCGRSDAGIQFAGLGNISNGNVKIQAASIFNYAADVENGQISAFFNRGKKIGAYQIGLINRADTISGLPLGLLNLISKGYNRFEVGLGETFHGSFALKLGVTQFYNIFFLGARIDDQYATGKTNLLSWGIGYGLGTAMKTGLNGLLNLELTTIHINEQAKWTNALHQLQQLRITLDTPIGSNTSIFIGPTANLLISKRINPETGIQQTMFAPYRWHESSVEGAPTLQAWGGFTAGIRFW